ncbi:uncharacterized protein (TIGR03086 family) [Mumia flava]|uniref:Uncharacterized protein (TIGR03086 family) n=1 Tax=Mumia flava TaxID=1348852 RepID=A0A0B2BUK7_9ACTN|nr:TIGR03086 family metal-binding protein [Mumia flava]PJJ56994.1 uncharacterized protein (TIGR03086 family) [Mumia flava]
MTDPIDLAPATTDVAALVRGVSDADLDRRTPCGWDVATLLAHLDGLSRAFTLAAAKSDDPALSRPPDPTRDQLDPEWRTRLPDHLGALADAWRDDAAWSGATRVGGVDLPGDVAGLVALQELVIHGWDLARSTDQAYEPAPESLGVVHALVLDAAEPGKEAERAGLFGPPVPVPPDAPVLDRVVGLAGRSPSWPG